MTQELITTLLPLAIVILLRLWNTGTIQASVGKLIPQLPKWAQPIPPMVLSVSANVVVWLVQGVSDAALSDVLLQGGSSGLLSIGIHHVLKRVTPAAALAAIGAAAKKVGPTATIVLLLGATGLAGYACSGSTPQAPIVCPIPSALLGAIPAPSAVANAVQDVKAVADDPTAAGVVKVLQTVLMLVGPLCLASASETCQDTVDDAKATLDAGEATREQVCALVAPLASIIPADQAPAELALARELCR